MEVPSEHAVEGPHGIERQVRSKGDDSHYFVLRRRAGSKGRLKNGIGRRQDVSDASFCAAAGYILRREAGRDDVENWDGASQCIRDIIPSAAGYGAV